jgi:hypothetical protein
MASITRTTSLLIEENKEPIEIPEEETALDLNFYVKDDGVPNPLTGDAKTEFGITKEIIEQASQSAYYEVELINKEDEKEQQIEKEEQQIEQKVEEKAKKEPQIEEPPIEEPPIVQPPIQEPQIVTRKERRKSQLMRDIEEQELADQALKEQQKQAKLKKKTLIPLSITDLNGYASGIDDGSEATSANRLIIDNIRLETYNATSQAMAIYGDELKNFTQQESPCALCGFPLKDRISYIHNRTHDYDPKQLTWSYDHFVPVNFSAVVFRIVTSKNYDADELKLLKDNGYIVCYHCNYEKSQRLFVTCKKTGGKPDFNNFEPNTKTITKFVNDLYTSTNKHGWADEEGNRTLIKCLAPPKYYKTWIRERIEAITTLAERVCTNIISQVSFEAVNERLRNTKLIVRKAQYTVLTDDKYKNLTNQKSKNRFKREYIARLFAAAELNFRSPWNWKQPKPLETIVERSEESSQEGSEKESQGESQVVPSPAIAPYIPPVSGPPAPDPRGERGRSTSRQRTRQPDPRNIPRGGSRRRLKNKKKNKRKTYRRKRLF